MSAENDVIVAIDGASTRAWLQAADVIAGRHRTCRAARRWIVAVHRQYPGCVVAVARQRRGRWCLVGLPGRTFFVRGDHVDTAAALQVGRAAYHVWAMREGRS